MGLHVRHIVVTMTLSVLAVVTTACGDAGLSADFEAKDDALVQKGGLDGPAVPVGAFLNGVLPTTTPSAIVDGDWSTTVAFPNLDLGNVIAISANPGDDRIYAGSLEGLVVAFDDSPTVSDAEEFIDLTDRVARVFEGGLLGLVFHPEFGQGGSPHRRSFYVYYSSHCPIDSSGNAPNLGACDDSYPTGVTNGFYDVWLRLSRFEVFDGTLVGDPDSEQILLNFRLVNGVHRGGGLGIRSDGYLYLSVGDQGNRKTSQSIVENFNGSVLRFAVNVTDNGDGTWACPPGTHQPRRIFDTADEVSGRYYCIPDDNGWLDPAGGLLEEYCAVGFRNPFRLTVDPANGRVWVGDVGQSTREEVDVVECGRNYGWPFREGFAPGIEGEPASYLGILADPVVDFTRSEAASIVGGYVYRGSRFPDLVGRYVVADYVTRGIWAVDFDEDAGTGTKEYLTNFGGSNLATLGQTNDGELFFGTVFSDGRLHTLDRDGTPGADAPARLSQTGAFANLAALEPSDYWVPYELNQPFWSDGAVKSRFLALPNDGFRNGSNEKVVFFENNDWTFPSGTVLMKHFELALDESLPTVRTRLETRFMVRGDDGNWYGLTYRWRVDQSDADLLTDGESANYTVTELDGETRTQTWRFPSRAECLTCHRQSAGGALGPSTHQLNGNAFYEATGRTDNQLETWNDLGMFSPSLNNAAIPAMIRAPGLGDVAAPLQDRARGWLDSNCGGCHRPAGVGAAFDARFTTPFESQSMLDVPAGDDLGIPGLELLAGGDPWASSILIRVALVGSAAMPPLAKALPDINAVDVLRAWVERLPSSPGNRVPTIDAVPAQSHSVGEFVALTLTASDLDGDLLYFDAANLPNGLTLDHDTGLIAGNVTRSGTFTVVISASDGPAVSVEAFTWTVTALCEDGSAPPCMPQDCSVQSGRSPTSALVVLCGLVLALRRRRTS
ncbi:MAG: PQQ-dependent sugar dehydrogenase [Myxococcota bacterium]